MAAVVVRARSCKVDEAERASRGIIPFTIGEDSGPESSSSSGDRSPIGGSADAGYYKET